MRVRVLGGVAGMICVACFSPCSRAAEATSGTYVPALRIKLHPFVAPPLPSAGVLVRARVNAGPPLRLLLDSGSQYVVLTRKAAIKSGCVGSQSLALVGAGALATRQVKALRADTVEVDGFIARDVPVLVMDQGLADGLDGVAPLNLFADYLIRLDLPRKSLELLPLPDEFVAHPDAPRVLASDDLLFVRCRWNENREGYFLFDTGASYTAISRKLAAELNDPSLLDGTVALQGGVSAVEAQRVHAITSLRVGAHEIVPDAIVAVDLSQASQHHQVDIQGLLGYPAVRSFVILVNYRDAQVRIEQRASR